MEQVTLYHDLQSLGQSLKHQESGHCYHIQSLWLTCRAHSKSQHNFYIQSLFQGGRNHILFTQFKHAILTNNISLSLSLSLSRSISLYQTVDCKRIHFSFWILCHVKKSPNSTQKKIMQGMDWQYKTHTKTTQMFHNQSTSRLVCLKKGWFTGITQQQCNVWVNTGDFCYWSKRKAHLTFLLLHINKTEQQPTGGTPIVTQIHQLVTRSVKVFNQSHIVKAISWGEGMEDYLV